ncbi:hypothetical protein HUJ05_006056 [Dendroctonus ponderosae]|nr:hypothetical protein HUJ05_006056 [Dendroctonus ponderosae]KAH1018251.1 hypothetical protein HUJ05_006056 [Dendroctonus ponderosae]
MSVFDKMDFPKKPNYEYTAEYFASKATDHNRDLAHCNNGDNIERNVEITNYLTTRKLVKTTKRLENKRRDYDDKRKKVQEQWEDLKTKESALRENFIRFNQFVKENQEKKERASLKITEQNQLKEERQRRMEELQQKCEEIESTKAKMDINIGQYRIYELFLSQVVENEASMQSINDLLKRYEALIGARKELNDIQQRDMMKLEKAKSNLRHLADNSLNQIAAFNNRLERLQERYEKARNESAKWERIHQRIQAHTVQTVIDTVSIKESALRMYLEICTRKKIKPVHVDCVEKQLLVVKKAIGEFWHQLTLLLSQKVPNFFVANLLCFADHANRAGWLNWVFCVKRQGQVMEELPRGASFSELLNIYLNRKENAGHRTFQPIEKYDMKLPSRHPYVNLGLSGESKKFIQMGHTSKLSNEAGPYRNLAGLQLQLLRNEKRLLSARRRMKLTKVQVNLAWRNLERQEKELRDSFLSFNQFCHENNEKRIRALKKLQEDTQLTQRRQTLIEELQLELSEMKHIAESMEANVKNHAIYQAFLDSVVEANQEFSNINDIIVRFLTLMEEKELLAGKQKENMLVLENAKTSMMKLIEEKNFVIMGLNNQIANLQARFENANIKALESEELVTQIKNHAVKQLGEIDSVKSSIWNVYVHMATSKKHPIKIKKEDVEEQMMYINRTLTELSKVNKLIKKKATKGKQ